jgi:hypothetical protein
MAKPKHNTYPVNTARASAWAALTLAQVGSGTTTVALP